MGEGAHAAFSHFLAGVFLAAEVGMDMALTMYAFLTCSAANMALSVLSLRQVTIHTLSVDRFDCLYRDYMLQG